MGEANNLIRYKDTLGFTTNRLALLIAHKGDKTMSKYDCNNIMGYGHEFRRLCELYPSCSDNGGCPLKGRYCNTLGHITREEIDILQKWSDEHPEPPKISKEERNFIGMFENVKGKRIFREGGALFISLNGEWYELRQKWFQFIGNGGSMTFEELLKLEVEE